MDRVLEETNKCITFLVELKSQLQLKEDRKHSNKPHQMQEDQPLHRNQEEWPPLKFQENSHQLKLLVQVVLPLKH